MYHPQSSFYCTDVGSPTIRMVTPPSTLPSTARNYTIRGLDPNTAYSGTVEAYAFTDNTTAHWVENTLPQGKLLLYRAVYSGNKDRDSFVCHSIARNACRHSMFVSLFSNYTQCTALSSPCLVLLRLTVALTVGFHLSLPESNMISETMLCDLCINKGLIYLL